MFVMANMDTYSHPSWHWLGERIGSQIRERRKALRLTQAELARRIGIRRQIIIELEKGQGTCRVEYLWCVLWALGMELDLMPKRAVTLSEARRLLGD